jgi:GTPase SAR1 family protein
MDLKTLKLELLERIALLEDEPRLLALKRLLDGPPTYTLPSEHLSVVREGEAPYLKLEDRMYTAAEVRALVEEVLREVEAEQEDYASHFTSEEWDAMDREREQADRGEGTFYTIDELDDRLKKSLGK